MKLEEVAAILESEWPVAMCLQAYDGTNLVLAFLFDCGPMEDYAYVVYFEQAVVFHVPSILFKEVRLRKASEAEREKMIPDYDPGEISNEDGAYTAVLLTSPDGEAYGYYIAAESISAEWVPAKNLSVRY